MLQLGVWIYRDFAMWKITIMNKMTYEKMKREYFLYAISFMVSINAIFLLFPFTSKSKEIILWCYDHSGLHRQSNLPYTLAYSCLYYHIIQYFAYVQRLHRCGHYNRPFFGYKISVPLADLVHTERISQSYHIDCSN